MYRSTRKMERMGKGWFLPFVAMVSAEFSNVAANTVFKAASLRGMSFYVFMFYTYALSSLLLLFPAFLPFLLQRSTVPASIVLKLPLFFRICLLALIGFIALLAGNIGIEYSSATLSSIMSNLTPAFTFLFALLFRMEKLVIKNAGNVARIAGTVVSMAGALVVVLYKGPAISYTSKQQLLNQLQSPNSEWLIGGLLFTTQYLLYALWYVVQSDVMKICPLEKLVVFFYALFMTIMAAPVSFIGEPNLEAWKLKPDIVLLSIIVWAMNICYATTLHSWGIRLKGPLYVATFKPLSIVIAAFLGIIFLGDPLHLGMIIGAAVISMGFYAVIWGKAYEEKSIASCNSEEKAPLLQSV